MGGKDQTGQPTPSEVCVASVKTPEKHNVENLWFSQKRSSGDEDSGNQAI